MTMIWIPFQTFICSIFINPIKELINGICNLPKDIKSEIISNCRYFKKVWPAMIYDTQEEVDDYFREQQLNEFHNKLNRSKLKEEK